MSNTGGSEWAPGGWEMFLLAECAPLGQFRQVQLAPKFSPGRLNLALQMDFPLLENELLLALIDNDQVGFQSVIVLTSRRIYWSSREADGGGGPPRPMQPSAIRSYGMDYALDSRTGRGRVVRPWQARDPAGAGRTLTVFRAEARLGEVLASFLRSAASAAPDGRRFLHWASKTRNLQAGSACLAQGLRGHHAGSGPESRPACLSPRPLHGNSSRLGDPVVDDTLLPCVRGDGAPGR